MTATSPSTLLFGLIQREDKTCVTSSDGGRGVHTGSTSIMPVVHTVGGTQPASGVCTDQGEIVQSELFGKI